ncbi:endolytic transglycosylase MltG [Corynebacterium caspium]|uniref:endolytic transglycosylase MltG n=1 Tax=Corynebacterium caspium TaxID=234828 RepID=UPI0003633A89|nr:endolytic transglycosylase MltG [Corynebacterium caspium]
MEPKYVKRRQRGLAVVIAAAILIVASVIYIGIRVTESKDYEGAGTTETVLVEVPEGSSLSELGPDLVSKNVIKTNDAFQSAAFMHSMASTLKPGIYRLNTKMSAKAAIEALLTPSKYQIELLDVHGGATLEDVTVVGGKTRAGIFSQITEIACNQVPESSGTCQISVPELRKVAAEADPQELGVPIWAQDAVRSRAKDAKRLEGLIRPGLYVVDPAKTAPEILTDIITRSAKYYDSTDIAGRAKAIGLSPYELLIAASLVEREVPASDFPKGARVILNRLAAPMRLQFDSTVNYGLDEQEVATTDQDREKVTPWNTYASDGLPATPIASPSDAAVAAMENPAPGNWLYFVTVDPITGRTVFNDDFESHERAIEEARAAGVLNSNRENNGR